jgi:hypothetical protein
MTSFKTLRLEGAYKKTDIAAAFPVLNRAGIEAALDGGEIALNFDVVDMKFLERQREESNQLVADTLDELLKIRSFSTSGGKTVFKSFNKEKRVKGKESNKKKRLGYEAFKKEFAEENCEVPKKFVNKIHCADSLDFLRKLPDNCVDLVFTSPPYNFGIDYGSTEDANPWKDYFDTLFAIFGECVRVLKSGGRAVISTDAEGATKWN